MIQDIRTLDMQRMQIHMGEYYYGVTVMGTGKPLVCFHGFSESGSTWDGIGVSGYRLIRIDSMGHGRSARPMELQPYTLTQMLSDLHRVIYAVAGERYALMGYSMGARLALVYALEYPQEVTHLVLESGSVGIEDRVERQDRYVADQGLAERIRSHDITWFSETWAQLEIFKTQQGLPTKVQQQIRGRRLLNSPHALAFTLEGSGQGNMPYVGHRLSELTMPVCYISGELDAKYTAIGAKYFGDVHRIVPQVGHNVHVEAPEAYRQILKQFFL
ncbi:2-succinyl-6-hydroxy-2,4-cyclohexadiene-1-carboxylate synthase [Veillonella sp. CHU594]|uniref:2-succinyl-6-hydroxy-2, 4-cyclohexadiene-1-carboxylate synthase n=1 Tax=Veillonella sp. CHU594 TaxID=2490948 RepID=UPI000F8F6A22|nr:2-succinyl-6-hydroxy-2,4-cyclohexadiene-1-carboxylate synthase [Veillonella sp. CHU594]